MYSHIDYTYFFSTMHFQMSLKIINIFSAVCYQRPSQITCLKENIFALVAFIWLSSTVCFQMSIQSVWIRWYKVAWSAFVGLSPVCVFKCLLKSPAWEKAYSHWLHFSFLGHCVLSNVCSKRLYKRKQSRTGCICLTLLQCAFSYVSSNCLPKKMHMYIGCIC